MPEASRSERLSELLARRYRAGLFVVIVLAAVLRVAVHLDLRANDPLFDLTPLDSAVYLDHARDIATGDLVGDGVFFLNPLYPYAIAPLSLAFGPEPLLAIRILQMLLGLLTIPLLAEAVRRFLSPAAGLAAAAVFAVWPLQLFHEQVILVATIAVFLNALLLLCLARLRERPALRRAFVAGLALGLAALARPNIGLFALLLPIWLVAIAPAGARLRFAAAHTALIAAGSLAAVLPVTIRNLAVGGELVPINSSGGVNLFLCNNADARRAGRMISGELRSNPSLLESDSHVLAERATGEDLGPGGVSSYWTGRALAEVKAAPWTTAGFLVTKLLMFLGDREQPSNYQYETVRGESTVLGRIPLSFGFLSPLALVGLVVVFRRRRAGLPFALLFLAYAVALAIFFPLARYRAPALPAAIPLAILGIAAIAGPVLDGRFRKAGPWLVVLAVGGLLVLAAPGGATDGSPEDRVVYLYNQGLVLLGRGQVDEAEAALREASGLDGASHLPWLGLAKVARSRGDLAEEQRRLEHALLLRPDDPASQAYLALNLFDQGMTEEGIRMGRRLVASRPRDGTALGLLAQMLERSGRGEEAFSLYRRAEESGLPRIGIIADQCHCLRGMGEFERALANAERGLRLDPESADLHFERALALIGLRADPARIRRAVSRGVAAGGELPPELVPWSDRR